MFFGANIMHPFLPMPPMPEDSLAFKFGVVMGPTHWMMMIGAFQFLGGLLVILGKTAPLGLVVLGPILVNILAFHVFLDKGAGLAPGLICTAIEVILIFAYRKYFRSIFTMSAEL